MTRSSKRGRSGRRWGKERRDAEAQLDDPPAPSPQEVQERMLEQIAEGGKLCQAIQRQLKEHLCPELETIIKFHRVLVLRLCGEAEAMPERFALVSALMKPVMEWARLEEKRKQRELAEQKYRDEAAKREEEKTAPAAPKVLTPETLERIERELNLF